MPINRVEHPDEAHRVTSYSRPRKPNASNPDAREPADDYSDLRVKALDHEGIWNRYNAKAGGVQKVVPAGEDE